MDNPKSQKKITQSGPASSTRRLTVTALLAALALALSWLESVIPFQPGLPGVKLGLPNLVIVFCLYRINFRSAAAVNVVRILLAGLMFSGLWGMLYSFCGAACSLIIMILLLLADKRSNLKKSGKESITLSASESDNESDITGNSSHGGDNPDHYHAYHPDPASGPFSILGVSMAGGVFHNLGQLLIAMAAVTNANLFFYFPVLIISGMITGIINGLIAYFLLKKLPASLA